MSLKSHRSLLKSGQISDKLEILLEILKSCSLLYLVVTLSSESVEYHLIYTLLEAIAVTFVHQKFITKQGRTR